jgi:hypothetical protein
MMKIATQQDVDRFMESVFQDENIYPYLTTSKHNNNSVRVDHTSDWDRIWMVTENLSCLLKVSIDRTRDTEFSISLYAKSAHAAGKAVLACKELIKRYRPKAINSIVHSTNAKSLALHKKIYGEPWGVEKSSTWNMGKGCYEDLYYFRKML